MRKSNRSHGSIFKSSNPNALSKSKASFVSILPSNCYPTKLHSICPDATIVESLVRASTVGDSAAERTHPFPTCLPKAFSPQGTFTMYFSPLRRWLIGAVVCTVGFTGTAICMLKNPMLLSRKFPIPRKALSSYSTARP